MTPRNPPTALPQRAMARRPYSAPSLAPPSGSSMLLASGTHAGAFGIGAVVLFFLFSHASEFIDTTGRLHLVMLLGVAGLLAAISAGRIPGLIATPQGIWLTAFTIWLVVTLPFSSWKGGSFRNLTEIWIKSYIAFFLIGGLIFTLEQCKKAMFWLSASTIAIIYYALRAGVNSAEDERYSVTYGSLGNSNDLASSLLMGVPFLLYVALGKDRNWFARASCALSTVVLLVVVFRTGSRGGLIAMGALLCLAFLKATIANKAKLIVLGAVIALSLPLVVSKQMMARYATIFKSDRSGMSAETASAVDSTNARRELMRQGMRLTMSHPVFGVGIGNFSNKSADLFMARGQSVMWFTCHDIFLLVSSETGIPGFIMFIGLIIVCLKTLLRIQKQARGNPALQEAGNIAFCLMASLTAYLVCGFFSTGAYNISLPTIAALTAALDYASKPLIASARDNQSQQFAPVPYFSRPAVARISQTPSPAFRS